MTRGFWLALSNLMVSDLFLFKPCDRPFESLKPLCTLRPRPRTELLVIVVLETVDVQIETDPWLPVPRHFEEFRSVAKFAGVVDSA